MDEVNISALLQKEIKFITDKHWVFIERSWPIIYHKYKHRTELKEINYMNIIKQKLIEKLGYTSVFFFLIILYTNKEYPGPYREIDKGLFILYHLVSGIAGKEEISKYMPQSTFHNIYKKFWMNDDNFNRLNMIADECLHNMFSTIKLRILSSLQKNPEMFKHITLIIDGHDSRLNYVDTEIKHSRLYSYKFKKSGIRTQIVTDMNDMIINVSKSDYCSDSSDGSMFLNMKLYKRINTNDIIAIDGGYTLFVKQFTDLAQEKGYIFSDNNFVYPIRKTINESLSITEDHFNKTFGSFRSKIENQFSELGNKFFRFNNNKSVVRMDNIKYYNLQFKVACILKNINKFVELFKIPILPHHKLWENVDFEFPTDKKLLDIIISNDKINKQKLNIMKELQIKLLQTDLNTEMQIDDYSDEEITNNNCNNNTDVPKFNERKRQRKIKRNKSSYISYEIEEIVGHKVEDEIYLFEVKWKGYSSENNSFLTIDKFNQKQMLEDYIMTNELKEL